MNIEGIISFDINNGLESWTGFAAYKRRKSDIIMLQCLDFAVFESLDAIDRDFSENLRKKTQAREYNFPTVRITICSCSCSSDPLKFCRISSIINYFIFIQQIKNKWITIIFDMT